METTRQTVFFSVVMEYQRTFWEYMGFYFSGGQIICSTKTKRAFIVLRMIPTATVECFWQWLRYKL